jgi:hypothetical protein
MRRLLLLFLLVVGACSPGSGPAIDGGSPDGAVPDAARFDFGTLDAIWPDTTPCCAPAVWTPMTSGTTAYLRAIWGSGPADIFAVGYAGTVIHYDGTGWSPLPQKLHTGFLAGVWGEGPAGDVIAVGHRGAVLRYDRSSKSWSKKTIDTTGGLNAIWGSGANDLHVAGWYRVTGNLRSLWVVHHFDGSSWTRALEGYGQDTGWDRHFFGIFGSGPGHVVAVGSGNSASYDGGAWTTYRDDAKVIRAVWTDGPQDVVGVGRDGLVARLGKGGVWTSVASGTKETLLGVWGASGSSIYIVGFRGTALLYDGASFKPLCTGTGQHLYGVWGTGQGEVYAVGDRGTILRYGGP